MSDHVRKQIRNNAREALLGLATTGSRVYASRVYPLGKSKLPGICLYTPSEDSGREDSPTETMRDVVLNVTGIVRISENLEDELDDIALEVEKALDELGDMDGLCKIYHGIQNSIATLSAEEADQPHGAIAMEFLYTYRTRAGSPDIAR